MRERELEQNGLHVVDVRRMTKITMLYATPPTAVTACAANTMHAPSGLVVLGFPHNFRLRKRLVLPAYKRTSHTDVWEVEVGSSCTHRTTKSHRTIQATQMWEVEVGTSCTHMSDLPQRNSSISRVQYPVSDLAYLNGAVSDLANLNGAASSSSVTSFPKSPQNNRKSSARSNNNTARKRANSTHTNMKQS